MGFHLNECKLDSCDCRFEFSFDDSLVNSPHTLTRFISKCSAHSSLSDTNAYDFLHEENIRKNDGLKHILANSPTTALYDTVNGARQLKETIGFNFSFSGTAPNRVVTISFTGITLTTNQKNTLQTALNTRFGSGKVLIA